MLGTTTRGASCPPHGPWDNHLLPVGTSGTKLQAPWPARPNVPHFSHGWVQDPGRKGWNQTLLGLQGSWHFPPSPDQFSGASFLLSSGH